MPMEQKDIKCGPNADKNAQGLPPGQNPSKPTDGSVPTAPPKAPPDQAAKANLAKAVDKMKAEDSQKVVKYLQDLQQYNAARKAVRQKMVLVIGVREWRSGTTLGKSPVRAGQGARWREGMAGPLQEALSLGNGRHQESASRVIPGMRPLSL